MMKLLIAIGVLFALTNVGLNLEGINIEPETLLGLGVALVLSPLIARQLD